MNIENLGINILVQANFSLIVQKNSHPLTKYKISFLSSHTNYIQLNKLAIKLYFFVALFAFTIFGKSFFRYLPFADSTDRPDLF